MDENEKRKLYPDLLKECMKAHEELSRSGKLHTALPPLESFTQDRQKISQAFMQECFKAHDNLRKAGDSCEAITPLYSTPQELF